MKIPRGLPAFEGERILLIVSGAFGATFYRAGDGAIANVDAFTIEKPTYTDRKTRYVQRGRGQTIASGASSTSVKEKVLADLVRTFRTSCQRLARRRVDHVYLFAPNYLVKVLERQLPPELRNRLVQVVRGDVVKQHPIALLGRLATIHERAVAELKRRTAKPEARRLLTKRESD